MRPNVLSIAGYDPSGGAGVLADIKIFENLGVQGQAVVTALTQQNEQDFEQPRWIPVEQILDDLETLGRVRRFHFVKIGLVQNAQVLKRLVQWVRSQSPEAFILWDPILKASAGFSFHDTSTRDSFVEVAKQISLITPNALEANWLGTLPTSVLLKGGHSQGLESVDVLINAQSKVIGKYALARLEGVSKHGTGCMLSAAITARVALGDRVEEACLLSRNLLQKLLVSGSGALCDIASCISQPVQTHCRVPLIYPITWDGAGIPHEDQVDALIDGGAQWIQLRMKVGSAESKRRVAMTCLHQCRRAGVRLIINDDVELCADIGADGVHLGLNDLSVIEARARLGSEVIIGGTANTPEHVQDRIAQGADYVGLGPYRHTDTKENLSPVLGPVGVGIALNAAWSMTPGFPVVVIGGIDLDLVQAILSLGARGVAVSSAIVAHADPIEQMKEFMRAASRFQSEV